MLWNREAITVSGSQLFRLRSRSWTFRWARAFRASFPRVSCDQP